MPDTSSRAIWARGSVLYPWMYLYLRHPGAARGARRGAGEYATPLEAVILVKPQFEAGREQVGKGGIVHRPGGAPVRDRSRRAAVQILAPPASNSRIRPSQAGKGNREFLLYGRF